MWAFSVSTTEITSSWNCNYFKVLYTGFETFVSMRGLFLYIVYFKETSKGNTLCVYIERLPGVPGNPDYLIVQTHNY